MRRIGLLAGFWILCSCPNMPSELCSSFYALPKAERMERYPTLSMQDQYRIYICGMTAREPPDSEIGRLFARNGSSAFDFLLVELKREPEDYRKVPIAEAFWFVAFYEPDEFCGRQDVLERLEHAIAAIKTERYRARATSYLDFIRETLARDCRASAP